MIHLALFLIATYVIVILTIFIAGAITALVKAMWPMLYVLLIIGVYYLCLIK